MTVVNIDKYRNISGPPTRPDGEVNRINTGLKENVSEYFNLRGQGKTSEQVIGNENIGAQINSGTKMSDLTREEVHAHIAASEARTETKLARLEGKLDLVLSKLDAAREDSRTARSNQWVIAGALALLIVAVAALFPVFFSLGTQVKDMVDNAVKSHLQTPNVPTK